MNKEYFKRSSCDLCFHEGCWSIMFSSCHFLLWCSLFSHCAVKSSFSLQTPILVNRGWVPRSWRDKALKVSKDDELSSGASTPDQESAKSSWWRFWSKKPIIVEVVTTFMMFLLMLNREFCLELVTLYWIFQEHSPAINSVEVLGVVRGSEKPSIFVPANDPGTSQWFYIDVPAIGRTCGLPENTLYIEDINDNVNPSNPYPVPKDANTLIRSSVMPQDHLNYTLTWYSHFLTFINLWI